jgi:hypothetical protein
VSGGGELGGDGTLPPGAGAGAICASQSPAYVGASGHCTIDFCIESTNGFCSSSYYIIDGTRVPCTSCDAGGVQSCVNEVIDLCNGSRATGQARGVQGYAGSGGGAGTGGGPDPGGCCSSVDSCGWALDDVCDCNGTQAWDSVDCASYGSDSDEGESAGPFDCSVRRAEHSRPGGWAWLIMLTSALAMRRWRQRP